MSYPCTIIQARYNGVYEGANWLAFDCHPDNVPSDATADDVTCSTFWGLYDEGRLLMVIGKGATPDEAYADMLGRLR